LVSVRAVLAGQQERLAAARASEKAADRAFKKEFQQGDPVLAARLAQLYRQRLAAPPTGLLVGGGGGADSAARLVWAARRPRASSIGGGADAAAAAAAGGDLLPGATPEVLPLGPEARPEGLDAAAWERFLELRAARAALEAASREEAAAAARATRWVGLLEARSAAAAGAAEAAEAEAGALRAARRAACEDVELRFRLAAGQVEAEPAGVASLLAGAVMVPAGRVEELNAAVRAKGAQKMEVLRQMKDFKAGIYALQWENKRWAGGCTERTGAGRGARGLGVAHGCPGPL
jgi:hypothetical protein